MRNEGLKVGKYRVIAELGHGGMADVYLAVVDGPEGAGFAKLAVVKRLRPHLVEDPEWVTMLMDEARVTARLNHPNVLQMLEVGVEGNEYFLAMEYLDGQPMHRIVRRAAKQDLPLPSEAGYLVVADTLTGLHHAHELADYDGQPLGVVHRDVTPHNIFVTYDGQVKVVDFGIAKAAGRLCETQHGVVKGKLRYMSPEQAIGLDVDRRCDIFAAGIILWEAATGRRFWAGVEELTIVQNLISGGFQPSPRAVEPEVPAEIDAICRKALAMLPEDRYATAEEMRADLELFLAKRMLHVRRELVSLVTKLFAKERANIRQVLNASVGALAVDTFVPRNSGSARAASTSELTTRMESATPGASFSPAAAIPVAPSSIAPMTLGEASEPKIRALPIEVEGRPVAAVIEPAPVRRIAAAPSAPGRRAFPAFAMLGAAAFLLAVGVAGSSARLIFPRASAASTATAGSSVRSPRVATVQGARSLAVRGSAPDTPESFSARSASLAIRGSALDTQEERLGGLPASRSASLVRTADKLTVRTSAPAQGAATGAGSAAPANTNRSAAFAPRRSPSTRNLKLDSGDPWGGGAKP